jgi:ketosteroid isomerase-like protein
MRFMKAVLATVLALVTLPAPFAAQAEQSDPVSVLKSLFEARNSKNSDAALALFADDGLIINVVGAKFAGRDNIENFLQITGAQSGRYELESVRSVGDTVMWTDLVTNPTYEKLGVAPVQIAGEAVIRDGKIKSFVTHFPASSMAKFEEACEQKGSETTKADGVLIVGQPCLRFLPNAWAQTRGAASK